MKKTPGSQSNRFLEPILLTTPAQRLLSDTCSGEVCHVYNLLSIIQMKEAIVTNDTHQILNKIKCLLSTGQGKA